MNCKTTHTLEEKMLDRRSFLRLSGLLGVGAATVAMLPGAAEAVKFDNKRFKVSSTRISMGTLVALTLVHESRDQAEDAMGLAFEEMKRLSSILNRYESATAVGVLNDEGRLPDIPPEVREVVSRALYHYKLTQGAFDVTVKPVVDLIKDRYDKKMAPLVTDSELSDVLKLVDSSKIILDSRGIRFASPGMGLTLDGIAKGYIVDRVSVFLSKQGIPNHLVNAGGDIRTSGSRTDGEPWSIAIEDPEKRREYPDIIRMKNGAVATSGNYEIFFDREKMVHHIVNPRSGHSPGQSTSVSVKAETAMDADALATGVFVMGRERGTRLINALAGCDSLVIDRNGGQLKSNGWKKSATI